LLQTPSYFPRPPPTPSRASTPLVPHQTTLPSPSPLLPLYTSQAHTHTPLQYASAMPCTSLLLLITSSPAVKVARRRGGPQRARGCKTTRLRTLVASIFRMGPGEAGSHNAHTEGGLWCVCKVACGAYARWPVVRVSSKYDSRLGPRVGILGFRV
jgi:hypothetical protein